MFSRKEDKIGPCEHPSRKVESSNFMTGGQLHLSVKTLCAQCDTVLSIETQEMKG